MVMGGSLSGGFDDVSKDAQDLSHTLDMVLDQVERDFGPMKVQELPCCPGCQGPIDWHSRRYRLVEQLRCKHASNARPKSGQQVVVRGFNNRDDRATRDVLEGGASEEEITDAV